MVIRISVTSYWGVWEILPLRPFGKLKAQGLNDSVCVRQEQDLLTLILITDTRITKYT